MLDTGVILEPVTREVLAISRALEAAMWHLGDDWNVGIDPDAPEVKGLRHPHRGPVIFGPDR